MKFCALLLSASIFLISCKSLPYLEPIDQSIMMNVNVRCNFPFIFERCRLIHSIEAVLPDGSRSSVIGILVVDPDIDAIHSVIMTIEGLVIFEALDSKGRVTIKRGLSHFDSVEFANALMDDIRLIFFNPKGEIIKSGMLDNNGYTCRYICDSGKIVDIARYTDGIWKIYQYNNRFKKLRIVKASSVNNDGFPTRIELECFGFMGYSLIMKLIEAEMTLSKE